MFSIKLTVAVERLFREAPTAQIRLIGAQRGHPVLKPALRLKKLEGGRSRGIPYNRTDGTCRWI
jgi:hypothetical protein